MSKKIDEYKRRREKRLSKRGLEEKPEKAGFRVDSIEAFYIRRNNRRVKRNLPKIGFGDLSKGVDKRSKVWYNEDGSRDVVNGEKVNWKTADNGKHYAINGEGEIIAGPDALKGVDLSERGGSGGSASGRASAGHSTGASYKTRGGSSLPKIRSGAHWDKEALDGIQDKIAAIEDETARKEAAERFEEYVSNLSEDDVVYQTQLDGDTVADVPGIASCYDRRVTGRSERCQSIYDERVKEGKTIVSDMVDISKNLGVYLDSLSKCFKGGGSTSRKIDTKREKDSQKDPPPAPKTDEQYMEAMTDITRFTVMAGYDDMVEATKSTIKELESRGYEIVEVDNKWTDPKCKTYKGIHVTAKVKGGQSFEIQIHSKEDMAVKKVNHKDYEIERDTKKSDEERAAATQRMIERYSALPMPRGIEGLKGFKH